MEYENGDGKDKPIEVLTEDGVRYLTGHVGEIPEEVWHRFPNLVTEGVNQGKLYLVERVLQQWPSELQEDTELDRKLWNLDGAWIESVTRCRLTECYTTCSTNPTPPTNGG